MASVSSVSCCNVCASDFNKSSNIKIACFKCEYECCRACAKMYILSKNENAHCMSCKVEWDRKFLMDNFDNVFMSKTYKQHRETICFERELGMLQATQVHVEKQIRVEAIKNELKETKVLIAQLKKKQSELEDQLMIERSSQTDTETKKFVRRCPNGDCLGFLSTSLKCELCGVFSCSECRETKGMTEEEKSEHKCKPEVIESVKMIETDSKPCPKCSSLIFKIEGCHQMFCVCCHTAFDWKTLRIDTGEIHNPEYFDYLRKKGSLDRNPNEVRCGRELDMRLGVEIVAKFKDQSYSTQIYIKDLIQKCVHIRLYEQPRFRRDRLNDNLDLRIMYMRKQIDKDKFKVMLQKREKEFAKTTEIHNVLAMFINCMTEIFYRIHYDPKNLDISEMHELRNYTNECLDRISNTYKSKQYSITNSFIFE